MVLEIKWPDWTALVTGVGSFVGVVLGYIPETLAAVASLLSILWVLRQWSWQRKDRKAKGK